jgi:primosomal protein N' (replication factor Y) (superfamily II helicase)
VPDPELSLFGETALPRPPRPAEPREDDGVPGPRFAGVVPASVPVPGTFTYRVPPELRADVEVGVRVRVPFGRRKLEGFVVELLDSCDLEPRKLRSVARVLSRPAVSPEVLELATWAARYYHSSLGDMLSAAVPKGVAARDARRDPRSWVRRTEVDPPAKAGAAQRRVLDALGSGAWLLADLRRETKATAAVLRRLEELGLIALEDQPPLPAVEPDDLPTLTTEQELALGPLLREVEEGVAHTTLLFGITGSGKTEVYLRAIARALELGRGAIVLVPEISLTPQTLERFRRRFGPVVAELHSQLSTHDRRREWRRVRQGEARVVVGPRSAVWAPVHDLGLIVVDEEHETTYKQETAPRYHARDLAVVRGKQASVPVVLGSATPALESYHNAVRGRYRIARLRSRPGGSSLPRVTVVDMGVEWRDIKGAPILSRALKKALGDTLERGERGLLFQNRRGFTTYLMCSRCGFVLKCSQCDIALTHHRALGAVICHFCDRRLPPPRGACPECNGPPLRERGAGTERIVEAVQEAFPDARVGRLDTDVVREGDPAHAVLQRFRDGELDVLVGTQMIAKGLDIHEVTMVGVISADSSLALPDFRATERTFQLVSQVAGRAGRGERPGRTIIQTFVPEHFAVRRAAEHDYEPFASEELPLRQALAYPPFGRLLKVLLRGPSEERVQAAAEDLVASVRAAFPLPEGAAPSASHVTGVLGPAPSPRAYLGGKYRWQALIKADASGVREVIAHLADRKQPPGVDWILDVDPYHML